MSILSTKNLTKQYGTEPNIVKALDDVNISVERGEFTAIIGTSGSGKSTLLNMLGGLDRPTSGSVKIDKFNLAKLSDEDLTVFRRRHIGFIFQNYNLVPILNVYENITLPIQLDGKTPDEMFIQRILSLLGLERKLYNMPNTLSGGQQQRVAIARALSMGPELLVADEPIASLDVSIQAQIINLFRHLQKEHGFTFLFIAHDLAVVRYLCSRVGVLYQGKLVEVGPAKEVFADPRHPYTRALLSAIPIPDPRRERARVPQRFDPAQFCREGRLREVSPGHWVLEKEGES